jgi:ribosomal protein S18 acetylase RimI-like enzyme
MTPYLRPARPDESDFAFEAKRDAMGPHIEAKWGWDEDFQRRHHAKRWAERSWFIICLGRDRIGTVALDWEPTHLQFGEFYIFGNYRGRGLGSVVLRDALAMADERVLETRLEFLKWNRVGALYLRHGFRVVSENEIHFFAVRPSKAA